MSWLSSLRRKWFGNDDSDPDFIAGIVLAMGLFLMIGVIVGAVSVDRRWREIAIDAGIAAYDDKTGRFRMHDPELEKRRPSGSSE
jgi:hypothetical protein